MSESLEMVRKALSVVAVENVRKQAGFSPFCAVMREGDTTVAFTALEGDSRRPNFDAFTIEAFIRAKASREQLAAVGYAASAELDLPNGAVVRAIMLKLEDRVGHATQVIIPYVQANGEVQLGEAVENAQPSWAFGQKPWWKFW